MLQVPEWHHRVPFSQPWFRTLLPLLGKKQQNGSYYRNNTVNKDSYYREWFLL